MVLLDDVGVIVAVTFVQSTYVPDVVVKSVVVWPYTTCATFCVGTVVGPMVTHDVPLYDLTKSVSVS